MLWCAVPARWGRCTAGRPQLHRAAVLKLLCAPAEADSLCACCPRVSADYCPTPHLLCCSLVQVQVTAAMNKIGKKWLLQGKAPERLAGWCNPQLDGQPLAQQPCPSISPMGARFNPPCRRAMPPGERLADLAAHLTPPPALRPQQ